MGRPCFRPSRFCAFFMTISISQLVLLSGCVSTLNSVLFEKRRNEPGILAASPSLIRSIRHSDWAMAESLIAAGKGLDDRRFDGSTPISLAAKAGNETLVRRLIATGTIKPEDGDLGPVLPWAVVAGDSGLMKDFLTYGANPKSKTDALIRDTRKTSTVWVAALMGRTDMVEILLKAGVKVNVFSNAGYDKGFKTETSYEKKTGTCIKSRGRPGLAST